MDEIINTESALMPTSIIRRPEEVLREAREAAVELQKVVRGKPKPVIFNGEQYIEFEDWQTVARFYGVAARVRETRYVQFENVIGFEAVADAIDIRTGQIVSSAEAMCLNDEDKWSSRTKYEWHYKKKSGGTSKEDPGKEEIMWEDNPDKPGRKRPVKERVAVGDERVPLFQLRSMAQTRAAAKCLRNVFAWVVVLAGYKPTVSEEMHGSQAADKQPEENGRGPAPDWDGEDLKQGDPDKPPAAANGKRRITEKQVGRLCAMLKQFNVTDEALHEHLVTKYGIGHRNEIPMADYDDVCNWVTTHDSGK